MSTEIITALIALKSNMDRFIDYNNLLPQITEQIFKIQYG